MAEFYPRTGNWLQPIYEVDIAAGTWRLLASQIGVVPSCGGSMADSGDLFRAPPYKRCGRRQRGTAWQRSPRWNR